MSTRVQPSADLDGPAGNERLTASAAVVLLVLLAAEGITIVFLRPLLSAHVFIGMLLVPPVALKLASTGWRFARYYTGHRAYRRQGPPHLALRLLAPALVASTLAVFASGIALLIAGPASPGLVLVHKASFLIWLAVTAVHVLAYMLKVPRLAAADWLPDGSRDPVPGRGARASVVVLALAMGLALGVLALSQVGPWLSHLGPDG